MEKNKKYNIQPVTVKKLVHLNKIHGINFSIVKKVALLCGFTDIYNSRNTDKFLKFIDYYYDKEKNKIFDGILFKKNIKNYQGMRHIFKLPVHGQRTHTNASSAHRYLKKEM